LQVAFLNNQINLVFAYILFQYQHFF